ncbi:26S proteasome regulatory subunit N12, partial [Phenoliferia sp. Uapishka_3]
MSNPQATKLHAELVNEFHKGETADANKVKSLLSLLKVSSKLGSVLPKSQNEAPLIALSLLRLLSLNNIAGFHTLLETLPTTIVSSTEVTWVTHVRTLYPCRFSTCSTLHLPQLEQCLMEGSYSRVWQLCRPSAASSAKLPRPEFAYFVSTLVGTVRNEIAACDEKAYETLPLADAKTLLFFESEKEVREFATTRNWFIDPKSVVHFPSSRNHPSKTAVEIPSSIQSGVGFVDKELDKTKVVAAALAYAKELESIV